MIIEHIEEITFKYCCIYLNKTKISKKRISFQLFIQAKMSSHKLFSYNSKRFSNIPQIHFLINLRN